MTNLQNSIQRVFSMKKPQMVTSKSCEYGNRKRDVICTEFDSAADVSPIGKVTPKFDVGKSGTNGFHNRSLHLKTILDAPPQVLASGPLSLASPRPVSTKSSSRSVAKSSRTGEDDSMVWSRAGAPKNGIIMGKSMLRDPATRSPASPRPHSLAESSPSQHPPRATFMDFQDCQTLPFTPFRPIDGLGSPFDSPVHQGCGMGSIAESDLEVDVFHRSFSHVRH